jgi:hypothetical protein
MSENCYLRIFLIFIFLMSEIEHFLICPWTILCVFSFLSYSLFFLGWTWGFALARQYSTTWAMPLAPKCIFLWVTFVFASFSVKYMIFSSSAF